MSAKFEINELSDTELNQKAALSVMGWVLDEFYGIYTNEKRSFRHAVEDYDPCCSMNDAYELVEHMRKRGDIQMDVNADERGYSVYAWRWAPNETTLYQGRVESRNLPREITIACITANEALAHFNGEGE